MQYTKGRVTVTNGSATVTGSPDVDFAANATAGNAFKVSGDPAVYTIAAIPSSTQLTLSVPYQGTGASLVAYQITRDYTPHLGLAEIGIGDQDWPVHLTQGALRKLDSVLGKIFYGLGTGNVKSSSDVASTTVQASVTGAFALLRAGFTLTANGVTRVIVSITNSSTLIVDQAVNWYNGGAGYGFSFGIAPETVKDVQFNTLFSTYVNTTPTANKLLPLDASARFPASVLPLVPALSTGTYRSVTVDTTGRVTAGSNPTTLVGYGITDAAPNTLPVVTVTADRTLALAESGSLFLHPPSDTTARTITIPANTAVAFPVGTRVRFVNQALAGTLTLAITTDTLRLVGAGTTGSRTLAANGYAEAVKITTTEWLVFGYGLT